MPEDKNNAEGVLSSFLDQMIAAKGENLGKNERLSLREELKAQLDEKINEAVIAALPDDKLTELDGLMDKEASDDEIEKFFDEVGINFDKVALQAALQFQKDYLRDGSQEKSKDAALENAAPLHDTISNTRNSKNGNVVPTGKPLQGTTSAVPGMSNVEGIARMVAEMSEGEHNA